MGCLLHELVAGSRAFYNDFAVLQYSLKSELFQVQLEDYTDTSAKPLLSETIRCMLHKDPARRRPSAEMLYEEFCCHCQTKMYCDIQESNIENLNIAGKAHQITC